MQAGSYSQNFEWLPANWDDLADTDTTHVGWITGPAVEANADWQANLDDFISKLAAGDVNPWTGPIVLQDGTELVGDGEAASETQIWYLDFLPEGVTGPSE